MLSLSELWYSVTVLAEDLTAGTLLKMNSEWGICRRFVISSTGYDTYVTENTCATFICLIDEGYHTLMLMHEGGRGGPKLASILTRWVIDYTEIFVP